VTAHPERAWIALACAALMVPLVLHAYAGTAARYVGDDYCGGYIFHQEGLLGGQRWFYFNWSAVPTVLALMALTEPGGARLAPWLPSIVLALWVVAGTWTVRELTRATGYGWSVTTSLLMALVLVVATVEDAPNVVQSLYLRIPMMAYTGPLVLLMTEVGFLARHATRARASSVALASSALLAFVGGCFGPVFVALQTAALGLTTTACVLIGRRAGRRALQPLVVAGLIGSLAALAVVALAPGNSVRQQSFASPPGPLTIALWSVLSATFMFVRPVLSIVRPVIEPLVPALWGATPQWLGKAFAMESSPAAFALVIAVPMWLALRTPASHEDGETRRRARLALATLPLLAFVLVVAAMSPAAYGTAAPPPPRALVIPQFALLALAACWGYAAGLLLRPRDRSGARRSPGTAAAVVSAVLVVAVAVTSSWRTIDRARALQNWASQWDAQERLLRAARAEGRTEVLVPAIGDVGGVGSIATDPNDWVNVCAARYYGFERITGVSPASGSHQ
jgi:hypothetical protein